MERKVDAPVLAVSGVLLLTALPLVVMGIDTDRMSCEDFNAPLPPGTVDGRLGEGPCREAFPAWPAEDLLPLLVAVLLLAVATAGARWALRSATSQDPSAER